MRDQPDKAVSTPGDHVSPPAYVPPPGFRTIWEVRLPRHSFAVSLGLSAVAAVALLLLIAPLGEVFCTLLFGSNYISNVGFSETTNMGILLAAWLALSYIGARLLFVSLRWRVIESDVPLCETCGCSLRGDTSGTCPECGRRVRIEQMHSHVIPLPRLNEPDIPEVIMRSAMQAAVQRVTNCERENEREGKERQQRRRGARRSYIAFKRERHPGRQN
jgi:hypothetical protein